MTTDCTHEMAKQGTSPQNVARDWNWCEGCGSLVRFTTKLVVSDVIRPENQRPPKTPTHQD